VPKASWCPQGHHNVHTTFVTIARFRNLSAADRHTKTQEQHGDVKIGFQNAFLSRKPVIMFPILPYRFCVSAGFVCWTSWPIVAIEELYIFEGRLNAVSKISTVSNMNMADTWNWGGNKTSITSFRHL